MSLFICSECECTENHSCCSPHHQKGLVKDKSYPNWGLMDMHDNKKMLCSECNMGTWHGEWEKSYPSELEKEYAKLSKYGYTTYFDHPIRFELFKTIQASARRDYFMERILRADDNNEHLIYDPDLDELFTEKEYMDRHVRNRLAKMTGIMGMTGINLENMFKRGIPHWKECQSDDERDANKYKAQLKRDIKTLKKNPDYDKELLAKMQEEYKEL